MKTILKCLAAGLCVAAALTPLHGADDPGYELHPQLTHLELPSHGPFVRNDAGEIVCIVRDHVHISADEGATWSSHRIFEEGVLEARPEQALIKMPNGDLVFIFLNELKRQWRWDSEAGNVTGDAFLHTWVARSEDGGHTWGERRILYPGYNGAVRDAVVTQKGTIVFPLQEFIRDHARHTTIPARSTDGGMEWEFSQRLDTGGRGHHDGSIESTVTELSDGRLLMILRTSIDYLYRAYSDDDGRTWHGLESTGIEASSSPAIIKRLESGRLILLWNRLYPEGETEGPRRAGQHSEHAASWYRAQLSMAFSEDDGGTWSDPVVIAEHAPRMSYPYVFEREPGVLWVTTMQGPLRAEMREADFVGAGGDE